jgi:hypothetical protein
MSMAFRGMASSTASKVGRNELTTYCEREMPMMITTDLSAAGTGVSVAVGAAGRLPPPTTVPYVDVTTQVVAGRVTRYVEVTVCPASSMKVFVWSDGRLPRVTGTGRAVVTHDCPGYRTTALEEVLVEPGRVTTCWMVVVVVVVVAACLVSWVLVMVLVMTVLTVVGSPSTVVRTPTVEVTVPIDREADLVVGKAAVQSKHSDVAVGLGFAALPRLFGRPLPDSELCGAGLARNGSSEVLDMGPASLVADVS